jgi:hypothetical protein
MIQNQIPADKVKDYMLAGKACLILYDKERKISKKFWIYAQYSKDTVTAYWMYMDKAKKEYIGYITADHKLMLRQQSSDNLNTINEGIKAMEWLWTKLMIGHIPETIAVLHDGRCGACGRLLTDPESILRGLGPKCAGL